MAQGPFCSVGRRPCPPHVKKETFENKCVISRNHVQESKRITFNDISSNKTKKTWTGQFSILSVEGQAISRRFRYFIYHFVITILQEQKNQKQKHKSVNNVISYF